jgi:hypothetical protein
MQGISRIEAPQSNGLGMGDTAPSIRVDGDDADAATLTLE